MLLLVGWAVAGQAAWAQLAIQLRLAKDSFLVYESLPVTVSIRNFSGRTIQLENAGESSWLNLMVTDENNALVPVTAKLNTSGAVLVPAGETISHRIDLLPLFQLRSRGTYRVRASVSSAGVSAAAAPVQFTLINGREIWKQTIGLPVAEGGREEYRTYALLTRREGNEDQLFVSVRDEAKEIAYSLVSLGAALPTGDPKVKLDRRARLHVLFQNGPRSYGYVQIDQAAKMISRAAYSDYLSRPELSLDEGVVTVSGGEQTYPKPERILTEEELNPPPPPKPEKEKKKSGWSFGKKGEPVKNQ